MDLRQIPTNVAEWFVVACGDADQTHTSLGFSAWSVRSDGLAAITALGDLMADADFRQVEDKGSRCRLRRLERS
ncbi:MAG: hypothetical protein OXD33_03260 [Rhodobacteraceae bacterium]|nr:hypothetical protein [Paracoccaceae bacterium]